MCCSRAPWLAAFALALAAGCSRNGPVPVERTAILSFENLSGDPSLDWMGRGTAELLSRQLAGARHLYAIPPGAVRAWDPYVGRRAADVPGISAERTQALAAGAVRLVYGRLDVRRGAVELAAEVEDSRTGKMVRSVRSRGADLFAAADALARQLAPEALPFGTRNLAAFRLYVQAVGASDSAAAAQAVAADPGFGPAWLALVQLTMQQQGHAAALQALEQAREQGERLLPLDRARLDLDLAILRADRPGRERALSELVRLTPADPAPYRALGDLCVQTHQYGKAAGTLRTAADLHPDDIVLLNSLGYAETFAGDLGAAANAFGRYRKLRPSDANPLDSLGDAHLYLGRPADAARYYLEAYERDPRALDGGEVLKAAHARLYTGDVAGAGALFDRYLKARRAAGDRAAELRHAEWMWMTGKRRAALEGLGRLAPRLEPKDLAARAFIQLALWNLQLGDAAAARIQAERSVALAGQSSMALARVALFLTEPPASSSEWAVRAERLFPDSAPPGMKEYARAVALLFAKDFEPAVPLLKQSYQQWDPRGEPGTPVLLAWALAECGRYREAAPLLAANPVPQATGLNVFTALYFPRLFFLRGLVREKQGKSDEAREMYRIYLALAGPDDLIWGEELRARAARTGKD